MTTVYVTHDQEEAMSMSDKVVVMNNGWTEQIGEPEDIYFSPASEFVGDFIGESNLFHGEVRVVNDGGGGTVVVPGFDRELRFPAPDKGAGTAAVNVGDDVCLIVRPEDILVTDSPSESMKWYECRSAERSFLGRTTRYHLMPVRSDFLVIADVKEPVRSSAHPGEQMFFGWKEEDVMLIKRR